MDMREFARTLWNMRLNYELPENVCELMDECKLTTTQDEKTLPTPKFQEYINCIEGTGKIKFFTVNGAGKIHLFKNVNSDKKEINVRTGYGFVTPDDPNIGDVFFHANSIDYNTLVRIKENVLVDFVAEPAVKGLKAVSLSVRVHNEKEDLLPNNSED